VFPAGRPAEADTTASIDALAAVKAAEPPAKPAKLPKLFVTPSLRRCRRRHRPSGGRAVGER
jgi:hypothetical protein